MIPLTPPPPRASLRSAVIACAAALGIVAVVTGGLAVVTHTTPATRYRAIDGDTLHANGERLRILGYDAPELTDPRCREELQAAQRATLYLDALTRQPGFQVRESGRRDRWGRPLVFATVNGEDVARMMIDAGLARPYGGGRREGWCP